MCLAMLKRILIVDDDSNLRRTLRFCIGLRKRCEICGEAIDGVDAIEKAETLNPDLIILDHMMPKMNGIDVGAVLSVKMPDVPIILFTAKDVKAIEFDALSVGIRAVVPKPDIRTLVEQVDNLLE